MVVANANGLVVPDFLTAQGYMWLITTYDPRTVLPAPALETFRAWRGDPYTNTPHEGSTAAQQREALLTDLADRDNYLFTRNELEHFTLRDEAAPLIPTRGASITPPGFDIPVAVMLPDKSTVDQLINSISKTAIAHYYLTVNGKAAKPDEGMLKALEACVPVIVLARVPSDQTVDPADVIYQAIFPVYIHRYSRKASTFELDVSQAYEFDAPALPTLSALPPLIVLGSRVHERRWSFGVVKRRLHQPLFSRDVMAAYQERCAVCGLDIPELLEAAHIIPDRDDDGLAWVQNGMVLCKNHHAAFDANLLAVSPDLIISVAPPLLVATAIAGSTLRDILASLHGTPLKVIPADKQQQPDPKRLATRFTEFEHKWSIPATPVEKSGPTTRTYT